MLLLLYLSIAAPVPITDDVMHTHCSILWPDMGTCNTMLSFFDSTWCCASTIPKQIVVNQCVTLVPSIHVYCDTVVTLLNPAMNPDSLENNRWCCGLRDYVTDYDNDNREDYVEVNDFFDDDFFQFDQ